MKRFAVGLLALTLALTLGGTALAAGHGSGWRQADREDCPWRGAGCAYVDANGDGVCDNRTDGGRCYVDADGDGVCDDRTGGGRCYVDANGDGICDNWTDGGHHGGGRHGWGRGCRN